MPLRYWHAARQRGWRSSGLGGLGHVGVQIATVMGASTTVINHMEQQMDDASRSASERSRKGRPT